MAKKRPKKDGGENRYRKISVRMHADAKYRRLSRPGPCGQALWWHLLAGEQTDIIPGLMKIGEQAFAELLGWKLQGFRDAFAEVIREGMAEADWDARLVWIPNALKHNLPDSVNVVKSWSKAWPHIPECNLKLRAYLRMEKELDAYSVAFADAFRDACLKPCGLTYGIQEQEQEQEVSTSTIPSVKEEIDVPEKSKSRPTLDEVRAYCDERGNSVNPEKWFDHYTANGWKVGKVPMKDWQAAVRQWERNSFPAKTQGTEHKGPRPLSDEEMANVK